MAYDSALLATIDTAIASLVAGTRQVSFTMGNKTVVFGQADLSELRDLRNEVSTAVLKSEAGSRRYIRTTTRKGL